MASWKFSSCPRCGGDVYLDRDEYTWYEECVQCGYTRALKTMEEFSEVLSSEGGNRAWVEPDGGEGEN